MKVKLNEIYTKLQAGESLTKQAKGLNVSYGLLYAAIRTYCGDKGLEMPKQRRGRKKKIIFEC